MNKKKIVLTGGGSAGHVVLHLSIIDALIENGYDIFYIGSSGIEKCLIKKRKIKFYQIPAGKLRRYWSFKNFLDVFNIILGIIKSIFIIKNIKPNIVFSRGSYVSVPVAVGAWILKIPVITYESDLSPCLSNKIVNLFAKKILYNFYESEKYFNQKKSEWIKMPIRKELLCDNFEKIKNKFNFNNDKKTILFIGGSLGARFINQIVDINFEKIINIYNIIHITGKNYKISNKNKNYKIFKYIEDDLRDILALSDIIVSRAGSNMIFELLYLKKLFLLIPLKKGSRGDQIENANYFEKKNWAISVSEKDIIEKNIFFDKLKELENKSQFIFKNQQMYNIDIDNSISKILENIQKYSN